MNKQLYMEKKYHIISHEELPEGDYSFTVIDYIRGYHNGSAKLPACNKATLYLKIDSEQGTAVIKKYLFLHPACKGLLFAFFTCIGQYRNGLNWDALPGACGRMRVTEQKTIHFLEPTV